MGVTSNERKEVVSYKELVVWQRAMELVTAVYKLTEQFPPEEKYGLTSQMRRAGVSIPSNIAEGKLRGTKKDYRNFLLHAFGSGAELETQLEIAGRLSFGNREDCEQVEAGLEEVMKMLNTLTHKLKD